jgi:FKBP-type peptidyl-prolyl cis-trans isomerase 2
MRYVKNGDKVKIHYTEKLENGKVLDTSKGDRPIEITIGNNIVPLLEKALKGMKVSDKKSITIKPEKAYGSRREDLIVEMKKSKLPEDITLVVGHKIKMRQKDGDDINAFITDIKEDTVTLDSNHPLAGRKLIFDMELMEIL